MHKNRVVLAQCSQKKVHVGGDEVDGKTDDDADVGALDMGSGIPPTRNCTTRTTARLFAVYCDPQQGRKDQAAAT
jgi:hypothetical protein